MWVERGTNLLALLALAIIVAGLVVLALPDAMEGRLLIQLDPAHSLREADLAGLGMVTAGAILIWLTVLAWQRRHSQ